MDKMIQNEFCPLSVAYTFFHVSKLGIGCKQKEYLKHLLCE